MYIVSLALALGLASSFCVDKERYYDQKNETCLISPEDVWLIQNIRKAEGRVEGKRTFFTIETIPFKNWNGEKMWLRSGEVRQSFMEMVRAGEERGFKFRINSSYRTWRHQYRLWKENPKIASNPFRAGPRSHMTGYAVDIDGTYDFVPFDDINPKYFSKEWCKSVEDGFECPTELFWWLKNNGPKFGWYNTVKSEPWHYKYLGGDEGKKLVSR